ncbi:MAG: hypothetical protein JOZ99_02855 [Actinobacteria bacterium]|nr:hypothetical protein [Actinomycetota bacterium]
MHAIFIEVNTDESNVEAARETLPRTAVPRAKEAGAKCGYWLAPARGRGIAMVLFDSEADARKMADQMKPGEPAGTVPGVTFKTVEVREVLADL